MKQKYAGLPVLWTTDFQEITSDYLEQAWAEMLDREYDFSGLFLSSYPNHERSIRKSGNYYCKKRNLPPWYRHLLNW